MRRTTPALYRTLAGLVSAFVALSLTAGTAQAANLRVEDPRGDVRSLSLDDLEEAEDLEDFEEFLDGKPAPGATPDVVALDIVHTRRAVTLRVRVADLAKPVRRQAVGFTMLVVGSNGQRRLVSMAATGNRPGGRMQEIVRFRDAKRVCRTDARSWADYERDVLAVRVPRHCLGTPARVRVGGTAYGTDDMVSESSPLYYDNATREGGPVDFFGDTRLSRAVAKG